MGHAAYLLAAEAEGVWGILTDPSHLLAELVFVLIVDVLIGMVLWPLAKRWVKRHDEQEHTIEDYWGAGVLDRLETLETQVPNLLCNDEATDAYVEKLRKRVKKLESANLTRVTLDDEGAMGL